MSLVDTHAHLTDVALDVQDVLRRARECDVAGIVVVSEDAADARVALDLCARFPQLHAGVGLHPERASALSDDEADRECRLIEALLEREPAVMGEIGLDFTPRVLAAAPDSADASRARQRRIFRLLLQAAARSGLPASVHSRGAGRHALDEIAGVRDVIVAMHAFDGRAVYAERALESCVEGSLFFSIPPTVVRDAQLRKLVRRLPLACLLLESDAPALAAEPAEIVAVVQSIAMEKELGEAEVREALLANTARWSARVVGCVPET